MTSSMQTFVSQLTHWVLFVLQTSRTSSNCQNFRLNLTEIYVVMYYMTQIVGPKGNLCGECNGPTLHMNFGGCDSFWFHNLP